MIPYPGRSWTPDLGSGFGPQQGASSPQSAGIKGVIPCPPNCSTGCSFKRSGEVCSPIVFIILPHVPGFWKSELPERRDDDSCALPDVCYTIITQGELCQYFALKREEIAGNFALVAPIRCSLSGCPGRLACMREQVFTGCPVVLLSNICFSSIVHSGLIP